MITIIIIMIMMMIWMQSRGALNHVIIGFNCIHNWIWMPINSLRSRKNSRHFTDDIFKCIFLNGNASTSLKNSLVFVPRVRVNNIPALVQIMAWRRPDDKPLSEPMMVRFLRIYASHGLNESIIFFTVGWLAQAHKHTRILSENGRYFNKVK